jgi:protein CWC15
MTTAHRPTWKAAVGKASEGGWNAGGAVSTGVSALSLAAHMKLKTRQGPQVVDRKKALQESLLKLEQAEKSSANSSKIIGKRAINPAVEEQGRLRLLKQTAEVDDEAIRKKYDDADADAGDDDDSGGWSDVDKDGGGAGDDLDASSDEDDDSDDDDSDDDEAALQAELAKIKAEREAVKRKKQAEEDAVEESKMEEAALLGNPLLAHENASGKLKRQWNDDVVFRNQAKGEPATKKRFINDTVRNDFHKRFLNKFIK